MSHSVRLFDSAIDGRKRAVLLDQDGPLFWPNVYVTNQYVCGGASVATVRKLLYTLGAVFDWGRARGIDLDESLISGDVLSIEQVEDLALFLRLSRQSQLDDTQDKTRATSKVVRLEQIRGGFDVARQPSTVPAEEAAIRCYWAADYFEFLLQRRLGSMSRRDAQAPRVQEQGRMIVQRLRDLAPRTSRSGKDDETLEGLPEEAVILIDSALKPDAVGNPFPHVFHRARNYLIWRLLRETGMRRGELVPLRVADVDFARHTVAIRVSKTQSRTVPISTATSEFFHEFILHHWSRLPPQARRHGYLFTTEKGDHIVEDTINLVFDVIRAKVDGAPTWLTPHTMRRTWNDRLSERLDDLPEGKKLSPEEEKAIRNRLQGWSANSGMAERYARRHIRRKADEVAENLANSLASERPR